MSKVIQGMKKATKEPKDLPDKKQLVLLWVHETCRQFRDRLLSDDIPWFDNEITTLYEGPLQMEKKSLMPLDELIFTYVKDVKEPVYKINLYSKKSLFISRFSK